MKVNLFIKIFLILVLISITTNAQIKNSIYSMFGIGQLSDNSFGVNRSLGGTGIAFTSGNSLNFLNPASYYNFNSSSHIVEAGFYGMLTTSKTNSKSVLKEDISFDYTALGFYLKKWWGASIGILPYSHVDYTVATQTTINGENNTQLEKLFKGSGGLNRIYLGNSVNVFDNLVLGFNLNYITGPLLYEEEVLTSDNETFYDYQHEISATSFYLDYGLQYFRTINDLEFTIGAVYSPEKELNTSDNLYLVSNDVTQTLEQDNPQTISLPKKYGFGLAVKKDNLFKIGLDYERANWESLKLNNNYATYNNSDRISLGLEYNPKEQSKGSWLNKVIYRIGFNYKNSYLNVNNTNINSYALSLGVGIPYDIATHINITFEYGREGTTDNGLIVNNYFKLFGSISLHEFWQKATSF